MVHVINYIYTASNSICPLHYETQSDIRSKMFLVQVDITTGQFHKLYHFMTFDSDSLRIIDARAIWRSGGK